MSNKDPFEGLQSEFGCLEPVQFAKATPVDEKGNTIDLKCDVCGINEPIYFVHGGNFEMRYCYKCSDLR